MAKNHNQKSYRRMRYTGLGMAIGLVFGGLVGYLIDNPVIFAGGTMVLGFAIGSAIDSRDREK